MKVSVKPEKPLNEWTNKDFLFYFSKKMDEKYSAPLNIPTPAWGAFLGRIKGFRLKLKIDNERYKKFIDGIFSDFFSQDGYQPAFGAIVSEKVYYIVNKIQTTKSDSAGKNVDWEKLRNELYSNNLLFQRFK